MKTEPFYFSSMNFIRILKILCSINTTKRVLRRFKKGLKNKFVLLKDGILKDDKGIKEYPK
ncbi:hypothetical protein [Helicobacter pylori]|uniref:Uncharacterized protein n=2 Tax=Helicobacter pylori TaxID=210 RepID=A0AB33Z6G9_HELPX|nr:hypothetical protein [Helicobacter pylori]EQK94730.1 hypothetical protein N198_06880 [Helicobacter pylori UM037]